ncbi:MAG: hypothetical protein R3F02_18580 [Thiolinea sp.]
MKERPISFGASMVQAILDGQKTHTRRTKNIPQEAHSVHFSLDRQKWCFRLPSDKLAFRQCPYGSPGHRLWVKEAWATWDGFDDVKPSEVDTGAPIRYMADGAVIGKMPDTLGRGAGKLRAAMFMPRAFSRIMLEIVTVDCERLHTINHEQAICEGIGQVGMFGRLPRYRDYLGYDPDGYTDGVMSFQTLWDSINGRRKGMAWADNPWVWDIGFKVLEVRS